MSEQQRSSNRDAFPATAALIDEFKHAFGADQVRLVWAIENGNEIGKQIPEPLPGKCVTAAQMVIRPKEEQQEAKGGRRGRGA